jgi:predicted nucleic acid-binding protein
VTQRLPAPVATIDTSALVSLHKAELLSAITVLFNRILIPAMVREELKNGGLATHGALVALTEFAIFEPCDDANPKLVEILLQTRRNLKRERDRGEAEAVIQAAQRGADMVLVDDRLGREWAATHRVESHGAIWLCAELRRRGYLAELKPHYVRMVQRGQRLPIKEMNEYLQEFDELAITEDEYNGLTRR